MVQMLLGLVLYGVSIALMVRARLGLDPWDVFHQGIARHTGFAIGTVVTIVGAFVLLLWIPLHQRPGIGTLCNAVLIGLSANAILERLPTPHIAASRFAFLTGGIVLCGVATGAYIGAGFGPGPRDGIMMGLSKHGRSIRLVRTLLELSVLLVGYALGGTVGIGTLMFAVAIGPIAHVTIPAFSRTPGPRTNGSRRMTRKMPCASG
jgi:uncharacterized membrane protein YczE